MKTVTTTSIIERDNIYRDIYVIKEYIFTNIMYHIMFKKENHKDVYVNSYIIFSGVEEAIRINVNHSEELLSLFREGELETIIMKNKIFINNKVRRVIELYFDNNILVFIYYPNMNTTIKETLKKSDRYEKLYC